MNFSNSERLRKKVSRLIPAGAHTYSKGDDQFPALSPGFIQKGKGAQVWDIDGNEFTDWGMGLRSVILGHADPTVLDAVREQLELGSNFTRPSPIEAELAEHLIEMIPSAEMVKYGKNGSDVTTAAVKLSRAYTGRKLIARCYDQPFFSVHDWFIGDTACNAGIPQEIQSLTKHFRYNNIESLQALFEQYPDQIACVILEPSSTEEPRDNFLQDMRELTRKQGAVLIFDEMITGLRWHFRGAQAYYGVTPDLSTFGKCIANGFAFSVLAGRRDIMELGGLEHNKERVFLLSSTNGGETHAIAAAMATLQIIEQQRVDTHIWKMGEKMMREFNAVCQQLGIGQYVSMCGVACSPYHRFLNKDGAVDFGLRTLFLQEMIRHKVLVPYIAIAQAHGSGELEHMLEASEKALKVVVQAMEKGTTDGLLTGPAVKPVFRKYN